MRIGIDCRVYGFQNGNVGKYTEDLISFLEKNDTENEYILFFNDPFVGYAPKNERFKKKIVGIEPGSLAEQISFLQTLYSEKLDLMHFTQYTSPLLYRKKSIVTIHDLSPLFYPGRKLAWSLPRRAYSTLLKSILKRAEKVIAVSECIKKDILETMSVSEDKIQVIHNGIENKATRINSEDIKKFKEQNSIQKDYLLYAGWWEEHKNLSRLIEAYGDLIESGEEVDLVIAGKEDTSYHDVRDTIIKRWLSKQVHILGLLDNEKLSVAFSGARAYVSASLYEGFDYSLLLAQQYRVPVACSQTSCFAELTSREGATFFNPLNKESIKGILQGVINNKDLRENIVKVGEKMIKNFTLDEMGAKTAEIYISFAKTQKN